MRHSWTNAGEMLEIIAAEAVKDLPVNLAAVQTALREQGLTSIELAFKGADQDGEVTVTGVEGPEGLRSVAGLQVAGYRSWGFMVSADGHDLLTIDLATVSLAQAGPDLGDDLLRRDHIDWMKDGGSEGTIRIPAKGEPEIAITFAAELEAELPGLG